jgi:predicted lipoprotein with Yx(FWY)xxD motif
MGESQVLTYKKAILPAAVVASLALSACGSSSHKSTTGTAASSTSSGSSAQLVKTAKNSNLGSTVLVNSHGLTLYRLSGEGAGHFICTSTACVGIWHPLKASSGNTPTGSVGSLSLVKRPDGTMQVAYKGMPLYTFVKDTAPGQANGQGIKDVGTWNAVTVSAAKSASKPSAPSSSSGGGYSY